MTNSKATYSFCGQRVSGGDLSLIKEIVTEFGLPGTEMPDTVSALLEWIRPNGQLKRVEGLQFLEKLEADGWFISAPQRPSIQQM